MNRDCISKYNAHYLPILLTCQLTRVDRFSIMMRYCVRKGGSGLQDHKQNLVVMTTINSGTTRCNIPDECVLIIHIGALQSIDNRLSSLGPCSITTATSLHRFLDNGKQQRCFISTNAQTTGNTEPLIRSRLRCFINLFTYLLPYTRF